MTWTDRFMGLVAMVVVGAAVVFAVVVIEGDAPATSDAQEQAECRDEVAARFDAAFALVAQAELNGGTYPPEVAAQNPPPLAEARADLARAAAERGDLDEVCPP